MGVQYNPDSVFRFILQEGQTLNSLNNPKMIDKTNTHVLEITIMGEVKITLDKYPNIVFWSSKSGGSIEDGPYTLGMESSGNLVLRNNKFMGIWSTHISEPTYQGPYFMQLYANAQCAIRNSKRHIIWHTKTYDTTRGGLNYKWYGSSFKKDAPYSFTLQEGQQLNSGMVDTMYDKTKRFSCKMQSDGNLVVRHNEKEIIWSSSSIAGNDFYNFRIDPKGNAVVMNAQYNKSVWATQTSGIPENFYVELKTNGQLLFRDKYREILWFSVIKPNSLLSPDTINQ
ncbi:hypothetical protein RB653_002030 [Dictyostelium firmibasis]|uniref:Bulb-type lectin domain-containing protein n=1 Tax=Dictyostelium firmibasis TaxID=79012 RepID=A0AAN7TVQ7_9MYCE